MTGDWFDGRRALAGLVLPLMLGLAAAALPVPQSAMLSAPAALAHGGGLDANGCHVRRATGEYHCHRPQRSQAQRQSFHGSASRANPAWGRCGCARKARCTGKRGGVYCINGSGNRRYF
jgi:hypothetical protein